MKHTLADDALEEVKTIVFDDLTKSVVAEDLAAKLGWNLESEARRDESFPGCLLLGPTGDLRCAFQDAGGEDAVHFAYHLGIEWVLDIRPGLRRLVNTRHKIGKSFSTFDLAQNNINELPTYLSRSDRAPGVGLGSTISSRLAEIEPVESIETVLIRKLAEARRTAATHSTGSPEQVDQDVHLLISQLFVLRAIEDIGAYRTEDIPSLRAYLDTQPQDALYLDTLYEAAKEKVEPGLFELRPYRTLSESAVRLIVESLYHLKPLGEGTSLNFGWIHPDVFGRVYERYTATILAEVPLPPQRSLFSDDVRGVAEHSVRKQRGVYYTPWPIVHLLVARAFQTVAAKGFSPDNPPRIADLTCGSGTFLLRAMDEMLGRVPVPDREAFARKLIEGKHVLGLDVDSRVVSLARILLYLRLLQEGIRLPLPAVSGCILSGDALGPELPEGFRGLPIDAIVGNPPFVPNTIIEFVDDLRKRFVAADKRFDYSSLFVERSLQLVKPHGAVFLVVPNRLFSSASASGIRSLIKDTSSIELLVDFGSNEVFAGVSAYVGLLGIQKGGSTENSARIVQVSQLRSSSDLWVVHSAVMNQNFPASDSLVRFDVHQDAFGESWHLQDPETATLFSLLVRNAASLDDIALVRQGIKTGANSVFLLERMAEPSDGYVRVRAEDGREWTLEEALLKPSASGGEVFRFRNFGRMPCDRLLLMPYSEKGILAEVELAYSYPRTWSYLQSQRSLLESRQSLRSAQKPWYSFAEVRDEGWRTCQKLLTRDLVPSVSFAIDMEGVVQPVGGTSVIPQDPGCLVNLLAIMNSSTFNAWLSRQSSAFRGSFYKVEPGRLSIAPVPLILLESQELYDLTVELLEQDERDSNLEREIDQLVLRSLRDGGDQ